MKSSQSSKS
jgi:serine/threonine protein kinase